MGVAGGQGQQGQGQLVIGYCAGAGAGRGSGRTLWEGGSQSIRKPVMLPASAHSTIAGIEACAALQLKGNRFAPPGASQPLQTLIVWSTV